MSNVKEKADDGSLPAHVINAVGEYSTGGFIVYYFNSKTGTPEHCMYFDSPVHAIALKKYVNDWSTALDKATVELIKNQIIHNSILASEDEEDDGDDEGYSEKPD